MNKKLLPLAMHLVLISPAAIAIDLGHDATIKGFGTVGVVNSGNGYADYVSHQNLQPQGAGRSEETSITVDSKLGLQLDWQATDRLSFTGQAVAKQAPDNTWGPELQWAFAKVKILPTLDVRAGRIRPAIYMLSDYLDVNYANPWVRPPVEFYSAAPVTHMEGGDFLWRPKTGRVTWLVQPFVGTSELDLTGGAQLKTENILGINLTASIGDFTFRAGFVQTDLTVIDPNFEKGARPALTALCNFDPAACAQLMQLDANSKDSSFSSLGFGWDNGDYFVSSELGRRNTSSYIPDTTNWYVTAGARFDQFTPYATYASFENDDDAVFTGGTGNLGNGITTNNVVTQVLTGNSMDQATITLGMRYDLIENVAMKFQWDRIETATNNGVPGTGRGLFVNGTPEFRGRNNAVDLYSVSFDFAF